MVKIATRANVSLDENADKENVQYSKYQPGKNADKKPVLKCFNPDSDQHLLVDQSAL